MRLNNTQYSTGKTKAGVQLWSNNSYRSALYYDDNAGATYLDTTVGTSQALIVQGGSLSLNASSTNPITLANNSSERARIDSNGYLLVGYTTSNGAYKLQVNSQIFATSSTIATSDSKYKTNQTPLAGALSLINSLQPKTFTWLTGTNAGGVLNPNYQKTVDGVLDEKQWLREPHDFPEGTQLGFIAQDVQKALENTPYVNSIIKANTRSEVLDSDGNIIAPAETFLGIAEGNLIALLTQAINELNAKFDAYVASHP
jgi:hypothetical protein